MRVEDLSAYEVMEHRKIQDLDTDSYLLCHKKSGARIALLPNEDENKVFYIGFRTPPKDSTGVAHIIEHTVLCGSRDFPVKDPFVELAKGSLNTFLNAMTYPDKTVYPVASCNDADFRNLMHVYLDAVFYPNIYKESRIFRQEGWHYEMENREAPLTINGVVYNEMKGAFSTPDEVLDRVVLNSLYPDTTYAIESGGDPERIPDLTYEQYLDFHRKYYHPSNSYIYLYGNMDMAERLTYLDEAYLSHFDQIQVDSEIPLQKSFDTPKEIRKEYGAAKGMVEEGSTYLTYNVKLETSLDKMLYIAFDVLDYALCSSPGAVLKDALIRKGIGEDVYSSYESGIRQPYFSIVAKNAGLSQKDDFVQTIRQVLEETVKKGLKKDTLLAAISTDEFRYREADFGRYPKGLLYGLQVLDSWLYDDRKPWIHIEAGDTFTALKEAVKGHYFEDLVEKYLLNNPHRTTLTLVPVQGLTERKEKELAAKLAAYKESLSSEEVQKIIADTKSLRDYQEQPDRPEDLAKIPLLGRNDLRREAEPFIYERREEGDVPVLRHDIATNGIAYVNFVFDVSTVPKDLFPYLGFLKVVLGLLNTEHYSYAELNNAIGIWTGGFSGGINTYTDARDVSKYSTRFEIGVKVLHENLGKAFDLAREILMTSAFDDTGRLKEVLEEYRARMQSALSAAGNQTAALRALSQVSPQADVSEQTGGLTAFRLLESYAGDFNAAKQKTLVTNLKRLCAVLFRKENLLVDFTGNDSVYEGAGPLILSFAQGLHKERVETGHYQPDLLKRREAFTTAGQVQYVARAGNFVRHGLPFTGALRVLKVILGYDYLWNNIRVKGGAYGCMSSFTRRGDAFFVTYRDPHLKRSLDVFDKASEYIRNIELDERSLTKYMIGTLSELDTPKTPSARGSYGMTAYLCHVSMDQIQRERDQLLNVTQDDIRGLADYIDAFLKDGCLCVVGGSSKIEQAKDTFDHVEQLVSAE